MQSETAKAEIRLLKLKVKVTTTLEHRETYLQNAKKYLMLRKEQVGAAWCQTTKQKKSSLLWIPWIMLNLPTCLTGIFYAIDDK